MGKNLDNKKGLFREQVAVEKKKYTKDDLTLRSDEVFSVLEITGQFRDASIILIYNSMADEVATANFIDRWKNEKKFYLPVVVNDEIRFCLLEEQTEYKTSKIGVDEPISKNYFTDYHKVDLIIVPGVAFDRKCNRLGRGKGYYDRFLSQHKDLFKIGICFEFQLFDEIPCSLDDVKMDMLVSENDLIW